MVDPQTGAVTVEIDTLKRDIGTVADAVRELNSNLERDTQTLRNHIDRETKGIRKDIEDRYKGQRNALISIVGLLIPIVIAISWMLLGAIQANEAKIATVGEMLRTHEIDSAYNRGLVKGRLDEHARDLEELKQADKDIVDKLVEEMHRGKINARK